MYSVREIIKNNIIASKTFYARKKAFYTILFVIFSIQTKKSTFHANNIIYIGKCSKYMYLSIFTICNKMLKNIRI